MAYSNADVIDVLVGIEAGTALDAIRSRRPEARSQAQASYQALFAPAHPGDFTDEARWAVAGFVAGLHGDATISAFYAAQLTASGASAELRGVVDAAVESARTRGPYGRFPTGPLSREDSAGPIYRVDTVVRRVLGARIAAAFEHVHLLVYHPRDASRAALQALLDAGWSTGDIVTLSQMVAFLSFQFRVVVGLRALDGRS